MRRTKSVHGYVTNTRLFFYSTRNAQDGGRAPGRLDLYLGTGERMSESTDAADRGLASAGEAATGVAVNALLVESPNRPSRRRTAELNAVITAAGGRPSWLDRTFASL